MGTLVATAVVGGVATGVVLPSVGRFATAFAKTPTVPAVAFGILPAQVVLVTHQVMTRVFKDRNWEAKNQIHVYAICLIDLAAGVSTTAIISTLTKTELPNGLAISFAGISAILIVLGLQSLSKKNDMLTENSKLLQELKVKADQIAQSQENPPPPPESPRGKLTALRSDFDSLTDDLGKTNSFTQQMSAFVNTSITSLNERFRRLKNKSENRDEEISVLQKELSKLKEKVGSLQPEIEAIKQKTTEAATNAKLARTDIGRVEQRIGDQAKPKDDAAPLYEELPKGGLLKAFSGFSMFGSKPNSTTDATVVKK